MSYARLNAQLVTRRKRVMCLTCRKYVEPGQRAYVVRPPDGGPAVVWHEECDAAALAPSVAGGAQQTAEAMSESSGAPASPEQGERDRCVRLVYAELERQRARGRTDVVGDLAYVIGQMREADLSLSPEWQQVAAIAERSPASAPAATVAVSRGAELIAAERQRQIEVEGYKPEHDAEHTDGELGKAAMCYVHAALYPKAVYAGLSPNGWPWALKYWKPKDRRSNLIRAGALIAAELDRLSALLPASPATTGGDGDANG